MRAKVMCGSGGRLSSGAPAALSKISLASAIISASGSRPSSTMAQSAEGFLG
jgi:hypothetical protein